MNNLKIRKPNIFFEKIEQELSGKLSFLEYFLNAMSLYVPNVEQFGIKVIQQSKDKFNLETQKEIELFIEQECNHFIYHQKLNNIITNRYTNIADKFKILEFEIKTPKQSLMEAAAFEHIFSVTSEFLLKYMRTYKRVFQSQNLLELWMWHALEEVEHRSIAFDATQNFNCGKLFKMKAMTSALIRHYTSVHYNVFLMMRHDKVLMDKSLRNQAKQFYASHFGDAYPKFKKFYDKDFHPEKDSGNFELYIKRFKQEYGY